MLEERARFNHVGITPKQVDLNPKHLLLNIRLEISNPEHLAGIKLRATTKAENPKQPTNAINSMHNVSNTC